MNARTSAVTILAVLLAVLTLASPAWAVCAWVLWRGNERIGNWFRMDSFDGPDPRARCVKALDGIFAEMRARGLGTPQYKTSETRLDYKDIETHQCFPDTVDPRGPKGSGR